MTNHLDAPFVARRTLLTTGLAASGIGLASILVPSARADDPGPSVMVDEFPHMHRPSVRNFVGACHRSIDVVREMLSKRPGLVHATWDWGFGDFETGLGAASHTGRREIAEVLIAAGARVDIFAAAMLGWTDVVRAMIAADPRVKSAHGPHSISLLEHARAGGDASASTLAMLQEMGDADQSPTRSAASPDEQTLEACLGRYRIASLNAVIEVHKNSKGRLECATTQDASVLLHLIKDRDFFPSGVPSVVFRFDPNAQRAATLSIATGGTIFEAERAD